MAQKEATRVQCQVCGRIWATRAEKKAICTNAKCKSTKVIIVATGEKYNVKDPFIQKQEQITAEKMRVKPKGKGIPYTEQMPTQDEVIDVLFEEDGKTPKIDQKEFLQIFKDLPKPSPQIIAICQNLSYPLTEVLGPHWMMAPEQAEFIAAAAMQVLNEQGVKLGGIPGHWVLVAAIAIYVVPNLLINLYDYLYKPKEAGGGVSPSPPPVSPPTQTPVAAEIEHQFEEFAEVYHESLNPDGSDKYADRRGIKKPGT